MRPDAGDRADGAERADGQGGPPFDGKDLHIGDFGWGILPLAAPLTTAALTIAGMAMAFSRDGSGRVALSFIGEGGSSLGEWHEAINVCAARRLPAVFCIENNQTRVVDAGRPSRPPSVCLRTRRSATDCRADRGRHRSRSDRRGVCMGGRARPRRARSGAHRGRVDADVRPRPSRRHAVSRPRSAVVVGLPAARRAGLRRPRA